MISKKCDILVLGISCILLCRCNPIEDAILSPTEYHSYFYHEELCSYIKDDTVIFNSEISSEKFIVTSVTNTVDIYDPCKNGGECSIKEYSARLGCNFKNITNPDFKYYYNFGGTSDYYGKNHVVFTNTFFYLNDFVKKDGDILTLNYNGKLKINEKLYDVIILDVDTTEIGKPDYLIPETDTTEKDEPNVQKIYFNTKYGVMKYHLKTGETFTIQL